jgi:hypothetical protein
MWPIDPGKCEDNHIPKLVWVAPDPIYGTAHGTAYGTPKLLLPLWVNGECGNFF